MRRRITLSLVAASGTMAGLACRSPSDPAEVTGSLEVTVAPTGILTGTESHTVTVAVTGRPDLVVRTVPYGGGTVVLPDVPVGTHWVRLLSPAATCLVTSADPTGVTVTEGAIGRARLEASCFGPPAAVFNRTTPAPYDAADRLVFEPDGRFRLQLLYSQWGLSELPGRYSSDADGTRLRLTFDANQGEWQATATPNGLCLGVAFNEAMRWDDFVDGDYCGDSGVPLLGALDRFSGANERLVIE